MEKIAVWKSIDHPGMEYLSLEEYENRLLARSVVIGVEEPRAFQVEYSVVCERNYAVRAVMVAVTHRGHTLLSGDGQGSWFDREHKLLPELDGCIDVDISATPFTNTLPIRRIQWQVGQSEVFKMVYILVPDLTVSVDQQRYTCLEKTDHGATFRYESLDSDFTADITVDSDGLVLNYPGLFERII